MKRIVLISTLICALLLSSCAKVADPFEQSISYKQIAMLVGSSENYTVSVVASMVESPYMADGIAEPTHEECKIIISSPSDLSLVNNLHYCFEYQGEMIEGTFSLDKLRGVLYANTGVVAHSEHMSSITISDESTSSEISLRNVMSDAISVDEVISIAKSEFAQDISDNTVDGVYQKETYVKYISDKHQDETVYYWYVAVISKDHTFQAILLSPSGEVIAKRK